MNREPEHHPSQEWLYAPAVRGCSANVFFCENSPGPQGSGFFYACSSAIYCAFIGITANKFAYYERLKKIIANPPVKFLRSEKLTVISCGLCVSWLIFCLCILWKELERNYEEDINLNSYDILMCAILARTIRTEGEKHECNTSSDIWNQRSGSQKGFCQY